MTNTQLGWKKAMEHANKIVNDGNLSREDHLLLFKRMLRSRNEQDNRIAIALLRIFISKYTDDFDKDLKFEDILEYGNKLGTTHWKDYGREVWLQILKNRSMPAVWVDKIADESLIATRLAFVLALEELSKLKSVSHDRILGMIRYFLDDSNKEVREGIVRVMQKIASRDSQRLHYFLIDHESGAGSNRLALIKSTREALGWKNQ